MPTPRTNRTTAAQPTPTATPTTTPTPTPTAEPETTKVVTLKERTIVGVTKAKEPNRYYIEIDGEKFDGYNGEGKEIETNSFSKNLKTLVKQIGSQSPVLNSLFAMANVQRGKGILNPQIVALCLTGATITIEREYKSADDLRETDIEGDTYGKNVWKTTIKSFKSNIDGFAQQVIIQLMSNPATLIVPDETEKAKAEAPTVANLLAQMQ